MPFGHQTKPPALLTGIAPSGPELWAVCRPVLAQIITVLHLTQEGLGMPSLWGIVAIADKDVWCVSPTAPIGVIIDDLDRLLFEKLNVRLKVEQQEKVSFQGGFERRHRLGSAIGYQTCEAAIVLGDRSDRHGSAILCSIQSHSMWKKSTQAQKEWYQSHF